MFESDFDNPSKDAFCVSAMKMNLITKLWQVDEFEKEVKSTSQHFARVKATIATPR